MIHTFNQETNSVAGRNFPCASLLLTALAVAVYFVPGVSEFSEYVRTANLSEPWRYVTCHWVHWNANHLFWSAGAFFILSLMCEAMSRARYFASVLASALIIPIGLRYGAPEIAFYGGLSGIDSALFALVAVSTIRDALSERRWGTAVGVSVFAIGFVAKVIFEMLTESTIFVDGGGDMVGVPLAHIVGALVGAAIGLWPRREHAHPRRGASDLTFDQTIIDMRTEEY